jgi:hypothetical protein
MIEQGTEKAMAQVDSDTIISAIRAASEKQGIEYISLWAPSLAALVSAAALVVIFRQMRAGDEQLKLMGAQIKAMIGPAATSLEQQSKEFAVRMMWEWVDRLHFETRQVSLLVHKLRYDQCKSLDGLQEFKVDEELEGMVRQCFPPDYVVHKDKHGHIIISGDALKRLRFSTIAYLNLIETILIAWDRSLAERTIIEEQFSFLLADDENALEIYRSVPSVKGAYPSIEKFMATLRTKIAQKPTPIPTPAWLPSSSEPRP